MIDVVWGLGDLLVLILLHGVVVLLGAWPAEAELGGQSGSPLAVDSLRPVVDDLAWQAYGALWVVIAFWFVVHLQGPLLQL